MPTELPWWKTTTIYQVYPRSFQDSNQDGIGDIPGVLARLDYIQELGFETIWFSPFFASPQRDFGYDVAGYCEIAPEYGTLADADLLIAEIHRREMKVVFDLVLNHTSNQHPWFLESSASRENPRSDWYIWRDGPGPRRPPNNWKALPGGSGWHFHPGRGQWYYASFLDFQPDLNWRNPAVKEEMFRIAKFWLDRGADGYRLDIFHTIYKAADFQDNPCHWTYIPDNQGHGFFTEWRFNQNQPETIQLAAELRQLLDGYSPDRFLIGEIFGQDALIKSYLGDGYSGMQLIFLWDLMDFQFKADFLWKVLADYEAHYPAPYTPVLVLGNHDSRRWIDRVGGDSRKARLLALLQMTARGVPVVYYGEEIGLPEGNLPGKTALDPIGLRYAWAPNWLTNLLNLYVNRDNCRTPMAWDGSPQGGFTDPGCAPWLPLSEGSEKANVSAQEDDSRSLLQWYKRLLAIRNSNPPLQAGSLDLLPKELARKGVLGYSRGFGSAKVVVLANFKAKTAAVQLPYATPVLITGKVSVHEDAIHLAGLSGGIFQIAP